MARTSRGSALTLPQKKKKVTKQRQNQPQSKNPTPEPPSPSRLLSQSLQTTDDWYKSVRTKKGYANYVKNGKKLLAEWTADEGDDGVEGPDSDLDKAELGRAFDAITEYTPTALRLVMAYKCEHLGRAFATAEGLRSAFKHYFERCIFW